MHALWYETTKSWLVTLHGWLHYIELNVCNRTFGSQVNLNQFTTSFHFICSKTSHMQIPLWICFTSSWFYDIWWFFNSSFCSHLDIFRRLHIMFIHFEFIWFSSFILKTNHNYSKPTIFEIQLITSSIIS